MQSLVSRFTSAKLLIPLVPIILVLMVAYIIPASDYISRASISVTDNFSLIGGFMVLLTLASVASMQLASYFLWDRVKTGKKKEVQDEVDLMRSMKATTTKKVFLFTAIVTANMLLFDLVGSGVLFANTQVNHVLTLLRHPSGSSRLEGMENAVILPDNPRITKALEHIIKSPGEGRGFAAHTAGVRGNRELSPAIKELFSTGTPIEQAGAAHALAMFEDPVLIPLTVSKAHGLDEYGDDIIVAVGKLAQRNEQAPEIRTMAGDFLAAHLAQTADPRRQQLLAWALGRLSGPEGLEPLEALLNAEADPGVLCTALQSLGQIGAADSSPKLIELVSKVDPEVMCPDLSFRDFTGGLTKTCDQMELQVRVLYEIAHIGDRRAATTLERFSYKPSLSERVSVLARRISNVMQANPIPDDPN